MLVISIFDDSPDANNSKLTHRAVLLCYGCKSFMNTIGQLHMVMHICNTGMVAGQTVQSY